MAAPRVLITFSPSEEMRGVIEKQLGTLATVASLPDEAGGERAEALATADAVLAWNLANELDQPGELDRLRSAGLIQLLSAGADHVPFDRLPPEVPVASNVGAYAEPMAEHVLAMALALAKRLPQNHAGLARGAFDQETVLAIRGSVVGVLGFGGIGQASAELFQALGARIHAINRSGKSDRPVDFVGTLADLDALLSVADVVVISLPLTRHSRGLIGRRELSLMKPTAILVNVARAAILDEDDLYEHLREHPGFSAGIDTWWQEPLGHGSFQTRRPFLELPNVLGSPHNSAHVAGSLSEGARRAAANVARFLRGEPLTGVIDSSDYAG